jgi:protein-tyrosine kinase
MSTLIELMPRLVEEATANAAPVEMPKNSAANSHRDPFVEEQILGLVRQLFLSGANSNPRQILFSAVDEQTDIADLCMTLAQVFAAKTSGTTCVVQAGSEESRRGPPLDPPREKRFQVLRHGCEQLSSCLWTMTKETLLEGSAANFSAPWLRRRLAELRLEFDYTILQGPAAGEHHEAALLGSLCDGVVLVLCANRTRRLAAQKVKEKLRLANASLLGAVLSERTFPIPDAIYRRL